MSTAIARRPLRTAFVVLLALIASITVALLGPQSAGAVTTICGIPLTPTGGAYPPPPAHIALSKDRVAAGGTVTATGFNFKANEKIDFCMRSTERSLGSTTATAAGTLNFVLHIPSDVSVGNHTVFAVATVSHVYDSAALTVTETTDVTTQSPSPTATGTSNGPGGLPFTGVAILTLLILAIIALIVGVYMTRTARRRRNA